MKDEISLLPRKGEEFAKGQLAVNVMYVGHKATTRDEQLQQNWSIEVTDEFVEEKVHEEEPVKKTKSKSKSKKKILKSRL